MFGRERRRARFCLQTFSLRPLPNRACHFHGTRLSSFRESLGVGVLHCAAFLLSSHTPCSPSPCLRHCPQRLSTMGTPSPWDSRPVGDPTFTYRGRSVCLG